MRYQISHIFKLGSHLSLPLMNILTNISPRTVYCLIYRIIHRTICLSMQCSLHRLIQAKNSIQPAACTNGTSIIRMFFNFFSYICFLIRTPEEIPDLVNLEPGPCQISCTILDLGSRTTADIKSLKIQYAPHERNICYFTPQNAILYP